MTLNTWITGLADVAVAATPFAQPAPLASKIFTAIIIINIVVGVAVIEAVEVTARRVLLGGGGGR